MLRQYLPRRSLSSAGPIRLASARRQFHSTRHWRADTTRPQSTQSQSRLWPWLASFGIGYIAQDIYTDFPSSNNAAVHGQSELRQRGVTNENLDPEDKELQVYVGLSGKLNDKLGKGEASYPGGPGIERFDVLRLASNQFVEDDFMHGTFPSPWSGLGNSSAKEQDWSAFGVFDGHLGWQVSETLHHSLVPFVSKRLARVCSGVLPNQRGSERSLQMVDSTIQNAFLDLDAAILRAGLTALADPDMPYDQAVARVMIGYSGSCALLSLFDPSTRLLRVACVGDSRAVLGRKSPDGKVEAIPLSVDQTGSNEEEIARLHREHPSEPEMVKGGRVLGIMVSRAFGDWLWKWPVATQEEAKKRIFPARLRDNVKTPPYLTAEPVITTTEIPRGSQDFVIMASDGFWDIVSNDKAVELVQKWRSWKDSGAKEPIMPSNILPYCDVLKQGLDDKLFRDENVIVKDDNVATHLVRNALGGGDEELVRAMSMSFLPPQSREVR
ncbi:MAG: hypothetical protein Q9227_007256 [Pyrenula ochraceoflavens]